MFYVYACNGLHPLNKSLSFTTRGDHTRWKLKGSAIKVCGVFQTTLRTFTWNN